MRLDRFHLFTLTLSLAVLACAPLALGDDWPVYRGDPALMGVAGGRLPDQPALRWSFETQGPIQSSAVIADGSVFFGSDDGYVYALALKDGQRIWSFRTGLDPERDPDKPEENQPPRGVEAPPLVHDGGVYIGGTDGFLYALDARTGELRWRYETEGEINGAANHAKSPDGQDDWILVGSWDNRLHCVSAATGKAVWVYETDNYVNGTPAIGDGKAVFGGCDGLLHVISIADGVAQTTVEVGAYVIGSVSFDGRDAFLGHHGNAFVCVDTVAGEIRWEYRQRQFPFAGSGAVTDKFVIFGGRDKRVHCVKRATGEAVWDFRARGHIDSSPVVVEDKIIVGSNDGRLYLLSLAEGNLLWSYEIGQAVTASPAVADGMLIIGSHDGRMYAFGQPD